MANRVPAFPLWEVLSDPVSITLSATAIGELVLILGSLWAAGDLSLGGPEVALQRLARVGDAQWRRNKVSVLAACRRLAPGLSDALALAQHLHQVRARNAEIARVSIIRPSKTHKHSFISDTTPGDDAPITHVPVTVRTQRDVGKRDVGGGGMALPSGGGLTADQVAARSAKPRGTTLRD